MSTSNYMADVVVEVAFNAGYATPAASRVWTDISQYVELDQGVSIDRGRADERGTADANVLKLTLDNRDGRFTPERASSPYFPNVKLFRPIRVTATPPGGTPSVRFVGYVTEWPLEWPGSDTTAYVKITATSRLSRLGRSTKLHAMLVQEILATAPDAYYSFGEGSEATNATDSSGNAQPPLVLTGVGEPVIFGQATGPTNDQQSAATFQGLTNQWLSGQPHALTIASVSCWFLRNGAPANVEHLMLSTVTGDPLFIPRLGVTVDGAVFANATQSPLSYCDGRWHHVAWVFHDNGDGSYADRLYVDGSLVDSVSPRFTVPSQSSVLSVGNNPFWPTPATFAGSMAHLALWSTELTAAQVSAMASAGFDESTGARVARIARYAGVPAGEVSVTGAAVIVGTQDTNGKTVLDALRDVESSESGLLFDARDGTLTLHHRARRYSAAVGLTLSIAQQQVGADYKPSYDPTALVNDATVTGPSGSMRVIDQASIDDYGVSDGSGTTLAVDPEEPLMLAGWLVNKNAEPSTRVPTLPVDVLNCGVAPDTIAAVDLGTLVQVSEHPNQAAATTKQVFVEGYEETFGPESWVITFNVTPAETWQVWQLGSSTRSTLDSSTVLAL